MKALITLAAVLSAVFVAAPAALADAFITDTLGGNGHAQSYRIITDTLGGNGHPKSTLQQDRLITDTLGGNGGQRLALNPTAPDIRQTDPRAAGPIPSYPFITDMLAPGGGTIVSAPPASGFGWADAGIGAAITAGLMLLLLGIARVMQQHRRRLVAA